MKLKKYIVHVSLLGAAYWLIIFSSTCDPLPHSEITKLVREQFDPACVVLFYREEPDELPQIRHSDFGPMINSNVTASGTADTGIYTSPSAEATEGEV